jgi:hypothetical protein
VVKYGTRAGSVEGQFRERHGPWLRACDGGGVRTEDDGRRDREKTEEPNGDMDATLMKPADMEPRVQLPY